MNYRIYLIRFAMLLLASSGGARPALAQSGDLGNLCEISSSLSVKGILSFRATRFLASETSVRLFLAVWHEYTKGGLVSSPEGQLRVYEKDGLQYREVFRLEGREQMEFQELAPLNSQRVPGLVVTFSEVDRNGLTLVVALVKEKFEVVYNGGSSELVDLDGDGIPEIFESVWPDGDGYPRRTIIHVWDGAKYRKLTTSKWEYRFSRSILNRLKSYGKNRK